tara:strand:+ start:142 stop:516 length:375 start_codon:yes stop_codon:yes gene_type:complete
MVSPCYQFRTLRARDLWLPLTLLFSIFFVAILFERPAQGWLIGMSFSVIVMVGQSFADAKSEGRYWMVLAAFAVLHGVILAFSDEQWIPKPTAAITPVFLLDYIAMSFTLPRLSGLKFDDTKLE